MKAPSETTLRDWWRKAVRKKRGELCYWPGCTQVGSETHHYIKRRYILLKYDAENGIPTCAEHHPLAETIEGRQIVEGILSMSYLSDIQSTYRTAKDFYQKHGMTRAEFLRDELEELKRIAK